MTVRKGASEASRGGKTRILKATEDLAQECRESTGGRGGGMAKMQKYETAAHIWGPLRRLTRQPCAENGGWWGWGSRSGQEEPGLVCLDAQSEVYPMDLFCLPPFSILVFKIATVYLFGLFLNTYAYSREETVASLYVSSIPRVHLSLGVETT